jgi:hypothetical protein
MGQHHPMTATTSPPKPSTALRVYTVGTALLVLSVLVQAVLAGRYTAGLGDILTHGHVGNLSFVLGFVLAVLAVVARVPRRQLILAGVVLLMLFVQTGLGYVGRTNAEVAASHVPLGVVTFALVILQHVGAIGLSKAARR